MTSSGAGPLLFEAVARPLLVLHAVLGAVTVGSATHHALYAWQAVCGRTQVRALRRFGWLAPGSAAAQVLLGLALYPTYRVRVRLADFEATAPLLAQWFDLKEHLAALALPLLFAAGWCGHALTAAPGLPPPPGMGPLPPDRAPPAPARGALTPGSAAPAAAAGPIAAMSALAAALVWAVALIGLYITARHPVGGP